MGRFGDGEKVTPRTDSTASSGLGPPKAPAQETRPARPEPVPEAQPPQVMAGPVPEAQPPQVMAAPPSDDGVKLSKEDLDKMASLCQREEDLLKRLGEVAFILNRVQNDLKVGADAAAAARSDRDKFCLSLEQKHSIPKGRRWRVDFKSGWIQFIQ